MTIADVVIIIGRIVGPSITYHLTAEGCWDVLPATVRRGISSVRPANRHTAYLRRELRETGGAGLKDCQDCFRRCVSVAYFCGCRFLGSGKELLSREAFENSKLQHNLNSQSEELSSR